MNAFMDEDDVVEGRFLAEENKRIAELWEADFHRLLDYVERHGDARVPRDYTVDGYTLGMWVMQQHVNHANGTLDADRARRLQELPGWTWKASSST
jgi:Helicase associated domain